MRLSRLLSRVRFAIAACSVVPLLIDVAPSLSASGATRLSPHASTAAKSRRNRPAFPGVSGRLPEPDSNVRPLGVEFVGNCGGGSFGAAASQPAPQQPFSIAQGDFNKDGDIDIAVPSYGGGVVTPYFGDGAGGLAMRTSIAVGGAQSADVMSGDLDRDGDVDLVAVVLSTNAVRVILNDGAGNFALAAPIYGVGTDPIGGAIGDLSGDGILDVVAANGSDTVSVLLGNGSGGLGVSVPYPAGVDPYDPILDDFDRDGDLDVLVGTGSGSDIRLLLNNGAGVLAAPLSFATGNLPFRVVAADFNEDGFLDVATANVIDSVSVLLGNGPASFAAATTFMVDDFPVSLDVADMNGDGDLDLAVTTFIGLQMHLFPGDGAGNFAVGPVIFSGGLGGDVKLTDVDTDGRPDLITANYGDNSVSIQLNTCATCNPGFEPPADLTGVLGPTDVVTRDFDRDGHLDLAVTNNGSASLSTYFGDGAGGFGVAVPVALPRIAAQSLESADFDSDGDDDLVVGFDFSNSYITVLLNNGSGAFGAPVDYAVVTSAGRIAPADFDRDGDIDLAVTSQFATVWVLPGNGDGTFGIPASYAVGDLPVRIGAADFDCDGDVDLVTANGGAMEISVLYNDGTGAFGDLMDFPAASFAGELVAEDFDRDGDLDIVTSSGSVSDAAYLAGNGTGSFAAPVPVPFADTAFMGAADMNGDGELDLVGGPFRTSGIIIAYGTGAGSFSAPFLVANDARTIAAALADFDTNGLVDIAAASGSVLVYLNINTCGQPCILICPPDLIVSTDPNQCGAVVGYSTPIVTGDCGAVTCVPPSGTFFPTGTTTVTCTADIGDRGDPGPASCSFAVTVNDTQVPVITCPANISTPGAALSGCSFSAVVTYPAPTVSDNCPGVTAACVPASGSSFPEGTTTVTCTATDAGGYSATCAFTVTVTGTGIFGACAIDDASGDAWSIVTNPLSPLYRAWRYRVAATGETFCGTASSMSYFPTRSLTAADNDDPRLFMNANLNYGANSGTVRVVDRGTGRQFVLRDRNLANSPPCP